MEKKSTITLDEGYAAMARDESREADALEWAEGLIGDVLDDPRRTSLQ